MSIFSKLKRDRLSSNGRHLSGKPAKFIHLRNEHSVKSRYDKLLDMGIKNDSLLQKLRVKFWMSGA